MHGPICKTKYISKMVLYFFRSKHVVVLYETFIELQRSNRNEVSETKSRVSIQGPLGFVAEKGLPLGGA